MTAQIARKKSIGKVRKSRKLKVVHTPAQPFSQHAFGNRVEFLKSNDPMVYMTREVHDRMWHYVDIAQGEVSWFGTVQITKYGNYLIDEVFLGRQEVSAVQTEISAQGLAEIGQALIDQRPDGVDRVNRLLFWGHSHVNMATHPSAQDEKQMEEFRDNGCPWFIRGILNKRGRMEFDIYLWHAGVRIKDAPWAIYEHVDESIRAGIESEFEDKVKQRVYTYSPREARASQANAATFPLQGENVNQVGTHADGFIGSVNLLHRNGNGSRAMVTYGDDSQQEGVFDYDS